MLAVGVFIGLLAGLVAIGLDPTLRTAESRIATVLLGMTGAVLGTILFDALAGPVWESTVIAASGAVLGAVVALVLRPLLARDRLGVVRRVERRRVH